LNVIWDNRAEFCGVIEFKIILPSPGGKLDILLTVKY